MSAYITCSCGLLLSIIAHNPLHLFLNPSDDDDDEDTDVYNQEEDEDAATTMPKKIPPASPPVDIESKMGKLRVVGEDKSNKRRKVAQYSFDQKLPFMLKDYFKNNKDYVEVEYMAFPFSEDHFKCGLSDDGWECNFTAATPEMFGEEKRMKGQMEDNYKKNDPRVIAHNNVVQNVRSTSNTKDKKFWGKSQTVSLPEQCEGPPEKRFRYIPVSQVNSGTDQTPVIHTQFVMICSFFFKKTKKRVKKEKAAHFAICGVLSQDSEDDDEIDQMVD